MQLGINPTKSVNLFWTLENDGVGFTNYTATLHFPSADIDAGSVTSSFRTALFDGSSWTLPVTASANPTSIQATGVTATGDLIIGENCNTGTTIAYSSLPYCSNGGTATVTLTGTSGGTFASTSGLVINSASGDIDLSASTSGIHGVVYSIAAGGGCSAFETNAVVTISSAPSATIAYAGNPYCSSLETAVVTLIGTAGGTFSSTAGLIIDTSSGAVDLIASTAGTYTVTYTMAASLGCALTTTTTSITVTTDLMPLVPTKKSLLLRWRFCITHSFWVGLFGEIASTPTRVRCGYRRVDLT